MLIECNFDHLWCCIVDKNSTFVIISVLEQFLTEVISKGVYRNCQSASPVPLWDRLRTGHQFYNMLVNFEEDHVHMLRIAFLELLLQVPTSMLIFA